MIITRPHGGPYRAVAPLALGLVVAALVVVILRWDGEGYRLGLLTANASGLVSGDPVLIGPAQVGSVTGVRLTRSGQAEVEITLNGDAAPQRRGLVARIALNGLAGIASHYVTIQPGPAGAPDLASGTTLPAGATHAEVSLDQLFDTFDPPTRAGLGSFIRGSGAAIAGRSADAARTIDLLDPALAAGATVGAALRRQEAGFSRLLVSGGAAMNALATRASELTRLVSATATVGGAIASRSAALDGTLAVLPAVLTHSDRTFGTLTRTLDGLDPVVAVATPAVARLGGFATALTRTANGAAPTLARLLTLLPAATRLFDRAPGLAASASRAFPDNRAAIRASRAQVDALLAYTPDLVAAIVDLGQAGATYDANGHYVRTQPFFNALATDALGRLVPRNPADRYAGLTRVHARCPGAAAGATPDGSAPVAVAGCDRSELP